MDITIYDMNIMLLVISFSSVFLLLAGLDLLSLSLVLSHFILHTERAGSYAALFSSFYFTVVGFRFN